MIVYAVTTGEYSDYHIVKIFGNKENAQVYCAVHNPDSDLEDIYEIEEYELADEKIEWEDVPLFKRVESSGTNFRETYGHSTWISQQHDIKFTLQANGYYTLKFSVAVDASEETINKCIQDKLAECKERCQYDFKEKVEWTL